MRVLAQKKIMMILYATFPCRFKEVCFVLQRRLVLSFDWMIATMLMSDVPSSTYNGLLYVDSDPNCFRMILSILRGMITVESEVSRISTIELSLLKATARYLLCDNIVKEIETFQAELQRLAFEKDELEFQLTQIKSGPEFEIIRILKTSPISKLECDCHRTRRSGNICNNIFIILTFTFTFIFIFKLF
jgi:hypothetical protein